MSEKRGLSHFMHVPFYAPELVRWRGLPCLEAGRGGHRSAGQGKRGLLMTLAATHCQKEPNLISE